ncbi:MAG: serine protein kinase [Deltaproteobacteria bacterium]|nr:serine protein kinase [Deltaproteobacteria bacterium]
MDIMSLMKELQNIEEYLDLNWEGNFEAYLKLVKENPHIIRSAYQRIYDMIMLYGYEEYLSGGKKMIHYKFFDDVNCDGKDAVYGLDLPLMKLVNVFKAAAHRLGSEKRVILLHGPVGSAKSTICRLLKRGIEKYSTTNEGALYSYKWVAKGDKDLIQNLFGGQDEFTCPMHGDPLQLVPREKRTQVIKELNKEKPQEYRLDVEGSLCPPCRFIMKELLQKYEGDWTKVMKHVQVYRLVLSEKDRVGIGTFQPKDEKNQDSTELTGDLNYKKIAIYGSDSDPRAFNFDGEFNIANRGMVEFIEVLKLDVAFLYDLLGASQEHSIKPKKFAQTDIDEVIIGHTNEPEYRKLQNNEFMEALRDRTIKIDIPYITHLSDEVKIYKKDFGKEKLNHKTIAPHALEVASLWAVLTRLEIPKKTNLTLLQKLKLYNGDKIHGFTEDSIVELRKETIREGLQGISPRYVQDKISHALVACEKIHHSCVDGFQLLSELLEGLTHNSLISNEEQRKIYEELLGIARQEYEDRIKTDVQRAVSADEESLKQLFSNYVDNVRAYTQREKLPNKLTGVEELPNERLMRSIEEKIDIPESRKEDFRREIVNYIGNLTKEGRKFDYKSNPRLQKALELKLFEDQKDSIKLSSFSSEVVDESTQERIHSIKKRLIDNFGYCEESASSALKYVSSIFARGDPK